MKPISKRDELKQLKCSIEQLIVEGDQILNSRPQNEGTARSIEIGRNKLATLKNAVPYLSIDDNFLDYTKHITRLKQFNDEQRAIDLVSGIETHLKNIETEKDDLDRDFNALKTRLKATQEIDPDKLHDLVMEMKEFHTKTGAKIIKTVGDFIQSASTLMQETPVLFSMEEKADVRALNSEAQTIADNFIKGKVGPKDLKKHLADLQDRKDRALEAKAYSENLQKEQLKKEARQEAQVQRAEAAKNSTATPSKPSLLTRVKSLWQSPPQPEAEKQPVTMHIPSSSQNGIN